MQISTDIVWHLLNSLSLARFQENHALLQRTDQQARTTLLTEFIRDAQYANDIAIFSDTPEGRLRKRVFDSYDFTVLTKVAMYSQCLMPLLMHDSETWTLYQHEVSHLRLVLNTK